MGHSLLICLSTDGQGLLPWFSNCGYWCLCWWNTFISFYLKIWNLLHLEIVIWWFISQWICVLSSQNFSAKRISGSIQLSNWAERYTHLDSFLFFCSWSEGWLRVCSLIKIHQAVHSCAFYKRFTKNDNNKTEMIVHGKEWSTSKNLSPKLSNKR